MISPISQATSRAWLEVDFNALMRNVRSAQHLLGGATMIPVLKGNAYGMGAVAIARRLAEAGCKLLAVATVPEALEIKGALPDSDVLVMGPALGADIPSAIECGLILALYSAQQAETMSEAAMKLGRAARVHIKLNTGLNRIGFDDCAHGIRAASLPSIRTEGLFTHLALHNDAADREQIDRLLAAKAAFSAAGIEIPMVHALDSIGMVRHPGDVMDGVRLGAWLYGVVPKGYEGPATCELICRFMARIVQIRELPQGALIGYDDDHPLPRPATIATVSVGYGDGYPRLCSAGAVEVSGQRARVVGIVSMDQMMVDVTGIGGIKEGDAVTLLGCGIGIDEYASWLNLNRNDALSRISRRVPRLYYEHGELREIASYL